LLLGGLYYAKSGPEIAASLIGIVQSVFDGRGMNVAYGN
jgi:hypothetical protein